MTIRKVIEHGYCVGCGACKLQLKDTVEIKLDDNGFYQAKITNNTNADLASKICPFSDDSINETSLGKMLFEGKKYDDKIGYYDNIYTGYVKNRQERNSSSSGGFTTWFAKKLLLNGEVDAIIHVGHKTNMFDYIITTNIEDLDNPINKKSRYYPVSMEGLVNKINDSKKNYLFIGIPCFVKAIRLAQKEGKLRNIKFAISLLCGHMKSADFATSLAMQVGVKPKDVLSVDFRVKENSRQANDYNIEVVDITGKNHISRSASLFGTNWGLGFFKHKACDFCDDIAGELADATFGDAWLPKYIRDSQGTNIFIIRNDVLNNYLKQYNDEIFIESASVSDFYESQAGNYRNRREGLKVRVINEKNWVPKKRLEIINSDCSPRRQALYLERAKLSKKSVKKFQIAKKFGSIFVFRLLMLPDIYFYKKTEKNHFTALKEIIRLVMPNIFIKIMKKIR